jgi:predicted O-methyltransferase YrrM
MDVSLEGVELNVEGQMELWRLMVPFLLEVPFPIQQTAKYRYFSENDWFGLGDAAVYFALIRLFKPKRIIEIGSGFSSAVALDTSDQFLNGSIDFTFIDPYPDRLRLLLGAHAKSKLKVLTQTVQTIPLEAFAALDSGDILFIDSTHILKTGSDVSFELFSVLPSLKPGVIIHFHDTFWPFEYPKEWVIDDNRSWNELYALRAFLMNNSDYEILFFNHYFAKVHHEKVLSEFPNLAGGLGGGLWLRKIR